MSVVRWEVRPQRRHGGDAAFDEDGSIIRRATNGMPAARNRLATVWASIAYLLATSATDDPVRSLQIRIRAHLRPSTLIGHTGHMVTHWVDQEGRYDGRRLGDWLDEVVRDVVAYADPVEVIVFGSVARGDDGPDSDIDLLVLLSEIEPGERHLLMGRIRAAISAPVPIDVFVATLEEFAERRDVPGSVLYWPAREGKVVYGRAA